ncbi:MAG: ATP-binding protein [Terricaulis sp.]
MPILQGMISRRAAELVTEALARSPAVALLGPRQVGKTTLANAVAATSPGSVYLDLERAADMARLADADAFLGPLAGRLVVIDEVHRAPRLFEELRGLIDRRRRAGHRTGQFLLLGSASIELLKQSSETLAGRIAFVELDPVSIPEALAYDPAILDTLWLRGGFPDSLLARSDAASLRWREDFIRTYLERDIQQFAGGVSPVVIGRLWTMLAHAQGGLFNASRFAKSLDVSARTVGRYLDLLEGLLLARTLRPWRFNIGKRVVAAPKIYLRDSGIVHALLNIKTREDLFGHPVAGASWEGLIVEAIVAAVPYHVTPWFYRTSAGAELDLVLELAPGRMAAFEIKRRAPSGPPAGFRNACDDIDAVHRFVVFPGPDGFPMGGGVQALAAPEIAATVRDLR